MNRHLMTAGQLLLSAALLAVTAYVLIAGVQYDGAATISAGQLAADVLLSFAAFVALLALYVAARLGIPPLLARWRWRRTRRRLRRYRTHRFGGRR